MSQGRLVCLSESYAGMQEMLNRRRHHRHERPLKRSDSEVQCTHTRREAGGRRGMSGDERRRGKEAAGEEERETRSQGERHGTMRHMHNCRRRQATEETRQTNKHEAQSKRRRTGEPICLQPLSSRTGQDTTRHDDSIPAAARLPFFLLVSLSSSPSLASPVER